MNGYRYSIERQKLCIWLEDEQSKLVELPQVERVQKQLALEQVFRGRLDEIYLQARQEFVEIVGSHP